MAPRGSVTVEGRLARIEESLENIKETNKDAREERRQTLSIIQNVQNNFNDLKQALLAAQNVIQSLSLDKCGERLDKHELRILDLEKVTRPLPQMEEAYKFWRTLLGTGFQAVWKIGLVVLGSGGVGSLISHWLWR